MYRAACTALRCAHTPPAAAETATRGAQATRGRRSSRRLAAWICGASPAAGRKIVNLIGNAELHWAPVPQLNTTEVQGPFSVFFFSFSRDSACKFSTHGNKIQQTNDEKTIETLLYALPYLVHYFSCGQNSDWVEIQISRRQVNVRMSNWYVEASMKPHARLVCNCKLCFWHKEVWFVHALKPSAILNILHAQQCSLCQTHH